MKPKTADDLITELFCREVRELGERNSLSAEEQERIITVFRHAMASSFMDDQQIYLKLTGESV